MPHGLEHSAQITIPLYVALPTTDRLTVPMCDRVVSLSLLIYLLYSSPLFLTIYKFLSRLFISLFINQMPHSFVHVILCEFPHMLLELIGQVVHHLSFSLLLMLLLLLLLLWARRIVVEKLKQVYLLVYLHSLILPH